MKKIVSFFILALFSAGSMISAQEYNIKVKIDGISDTTIMLGHHYGKKKFVVDTTKLDESGTAVFEGDKKLDRGIYLMIMPSLKNAYFELLMDDDQKFTLETDTSNYVENMKVKGSKSNEVFNQYQKKMGELQRKSTKLNKKVQSSDKGSEEFKEAKDKLKKLNEERLEYMKNIADKNEGELMGSIVQAIIEPEIPDAPKDENGNIKDSSFQYRYYKEHYFDNIDWTEPGLIRTPILEPKVNRYFKKVLPPVADSVKPVVNDLLIEVQKANYEMFKYMTSHLLNYFETSKVMGMDEVFVDIAEKWYLSGKADWADSTLVSKIRERVEKISPNIIGNKAPNIKQVPTYDGKYASLHEVNAEYTILVFWEPDCGHCKKVVPKLYKMYQDSMSNYDVEVFAMYTQREKEKWEKFIEKKELFDWINVYDPYGMSKFRDNYDIYSTPVIYILGEEKKIIAKRIDVNYILEFLEYDKKKKNKEKGKNGE